MYACVRLTFPPPAATTAPRSSGSSTTARNTLKHTIAGTECGTQNTLSTHTHTTHSNLRLQEGVILTRLNFLSSLAKQKPTGKKASTSPLCSRSGGLACEQQYPHCMGLGMMTLWVPSLL